MSMDAVHITPATADDAGTVQRIMREGFAEYDGVLHPPTSSLSETVEDVRRAIEVGGAMIAWIRDEAAGCARFELKPGEMYVGRVAVLPPFRRRGIASTMMRALESQARQAGVGAVRVGVRMSLPANVALYERLGYELIAVEPHPRGPDRVGTMVKRLD